MTRKLILNPMVLYPDPKTCLADQKSKGLTDAAAKKACNALMVNLLTDAATDRFDVQLHVDKLRYEKSDACGGDVLVVPVTFTREGVQNGGFKPWEELKSTSFLLNNKPITLLHPTEPVREPREIHGLTRNVTPNEDARQLDGEAVFFMCESWLRDSLGYTDEDMAQHMGLTTAIEAGAKLDGSVGFYADVEESKGEHKGRKYDHIQRKLNYDHFAIVPQGACSWDDGCGFNRDAKTAKKGDRVAFRGTTHPAGQDGHTHDFWLSVWSDEKGVKRFNFWTTDYPPHDPNQINEVRVEHSHEWGSPEKTNVVLDHAHDLNLPDDVLAEIKGAKPPEPLNYNAEGEGAPAKKPKAGDIPDDRSISAVQAFLEALGFEVQIISDGKTASASPAATAAPASSQPAGAPEPDNEENPTMKPNTNTNTAAGQNAGDGTQGGQPAAPALAPVVSVADAQKIVKDAVTEALQAQRVQDAAATERAALIKEAATLAKKPAEHFQAWTTDTIKTFVESLPRQADRSILANDAQPGADGARKSFSDSLYLRPQTEAPFESAKKL